MLLFVGVLVATLFSTARAVSMEFFDPPTVVSGSGAFLVDISIPSGQRVPILSVEAIVEQAAPGQTGKLGAGVVSRARCPMSVSSDCQGASLQQVAGTAGVVFRIQGLGAFANAVSTPNQLSTGYFGAGTITGTRTGYGYDTVSQDFLDFGYGQGYGYKTGDVTTFLVGAGDGYGYASGTLVLRFGVTISTQSLTSGTYYLTVLALTGSATIGDLSSPFTEFSAIQGSQGGGGGGGGGAAPAPAPAPAPGAGTTDAQLSSTPSPGASATYTASFSSATGVSQLTINFPDAAPLDNLVLFFDSMATSVQVTVDIFTTAPPGVTVPGGANPVQFFVITVQSGASRVASAEFQLDVPTNTIQNVLRRQLVLVHYRAGRGDVDASTDAPQGEADAGLDVIKLFQLPDTPGEAHFQARTTGLSPFALLADIQSPTVTLSVPSGTLSGIQRLAVTAADNLKIDRIQIFVDGVLQQTIAGASGSYDWDTSGVADGTHSVEAKAFDAADNEISQSASVFTANQATASPAPPPKPPTKFPWGTILLVAVVIAIIAAVVLVVRKRMGPKPPPGGPGTPPSGGGSPPSGGGPGPPPYGGGPPPGGPSGPGDPR